MRRVVIEERQRVLDDFFKVEAARLQFEHFDGSMSPVVRRLNFERGDAAAALIFKPKTQTIVLISQFRYPTYEKGPGWMTEVVAGMIEKNDSPEKTIEREILEEIGYEVTRLEQIATFYVSPGGSSERISLFYAEVDETQRHGKGGGLASEQEDIRTVEMSLGEALEQVRAGTIVDAKTIVGLFWLQNRFNSRS
jgi:ADP-ribose pyrophosphatase